MYTTEKFKQLMSEVETEFSGFLAKAESEASITVKVDQPLAKSEDESKKDESKKEPEGKKEEPKSDESKPAAPAEEKPAAEAAPKDEAQAESKEAPKAEGEAPAAAQGEDHCDYDDEDHKHMDAMYSSMSKGELRAHHDSVKKALDGHGMAKCGEQMAMAKSETIEVKTEIVANTAETDLLKSEIVAKDAEIADLKKNLDVATEFLNKLFTRKSAPAGRAVTDISLIAKSEANEEKTLTKSEIDRILNDKTRDPSLKKSDRDAINAFYLNGASINTISHLLTK